MASTRKEELPMDEDEDEDEGDYNLQAETDSQAAIIVDAIARRDGSNNGSKESESDNAPTVGKIMCKGLGITMDCGMGITMDAFTMDAKIRRDGSNNGSDESDGDSSESDNAPTTMAKNLNPEFSELYKAVKGGDIAFIQERAPDMESSLLLETSPKSNTILHVAASFGHDKLVQAILKIQRCEELVVARNSTGDLVLHVAASAGNLTIVQLLVSSYPQLLRGKNEEKNTPLHVALINKYQHVRCNWALKTKYNEVAKFLVERACRALKTEYNEVAKFLVERDPEVSYYLNMEHKSPLYMAAEAGDAELVELMQSKASHHPDVNGKSIVHAAIYGAFTTNNIDVLDTVLRNQRNLIKAEGDKKMTPLSYAASIGYHKGVIYLLENFPDCAYERDQYGCFPVHTASSKGHIEVLKVFLEKYPDLSESLNGKGQNILHVAAKSGKAKVVAHLLKRNDLKLLINEKDKKGNTPLHLASEKRHPKVVSNLTWDKRVSLNLLNKEGKTAFDVAADFGGNNPSFRERLTWQALKYVEAPHAFQRRISRKHEKNTGKRYLSKKKQKKEGTDEYIDRVNTLLVVATLVATVTFAAAYTMPGGYNGSGGVATFLEKHMFQVFIICNTIAMYSAITVVVALIWAQLDDRNLVIAALNFSVPILGLALTMVCVAFMAGNYLVLRNLNWLAYLVLIIGTFFLLALSMLFFPLCLPSSTHHVIPLCILYYPFLLLIKVTRSDIDDREEK